QALDSWVRDCIANPNDSKCATRPPDPGPTRIVQVSARTVAPAPAVSFSMGFGASSTLYVEVVTGNTSQTVGLDILGSAGIFAQSHDKAPQAPGEYLDAPATSCLKVGGSLILGRVPGMPPLVSSLISPIDVHICAPMYIAAPEAGFTSRISGIGASVMGIDGVPNPQLGFQGYDQFVQATPTPGQPYSIKFSNFDYRALLQDQFQLQVSASLYTYYQSQRWNTAGTIVPFMSTPYPPDPFSIVDVIAQCRNNPTQANCQTLANPGLYTAEIQNILGSLFQQGSQPTEMVIPVDSSGLGTVTIDEYAPHAVDSKGMKMKFTGKGFAPVKNAQGQLVDWTGVSAVNYDGVQLVKSATPTDALGTFYLDAVSPDTLLWVNIPGHAPTFAPDALSGLSAPIQIVAWKKSFVKQLLVAQPPLPALDPNGLPFIMPLSGGVAELYFLSPDTDHHFVEQPGKLIEVRVDGASVAFARCDPGSQSLLCTGNFANTSAWVFQAPEHAAGSAHVTVKAACESTGQTLAPCGSSAPSSWDVLTYPDTPHLTSVDVISTSGGDVLVLRGTGLTGAGFFTFGDVFPAQTLIVCNPSAAYAAYQEQTRQQVADAFCGSVAPSHRLMAPDDRIDTELILAPAPPLPFGKPAGTVETVQVSLLCGGGQPLFGGVTCGDSEVLSYVYPGTAQTVTFNPLAN
ncbi:MAG: hypothetical protein JST92_27135, partial [Deltaproteobacteria bacterium]|nr:hypothetical protein [Deltaproteobacteria bacterium]